MVVELVHVLGDVPPVVAVSYAGRPLSGGPQNDSGFLVVFSDAPSPDEWAAQDPEESLRAQRWRPLTEILEEHPELVDAFEQAQWLGEVRADGQGGWEPLEDEA